MRKASEREDLFRGPHCKRNLSWKWSVRDYRDNIRKEYDINHNEALEERGMDEEPEL